MPELHKGALSPPPQQAVAAALPAPPSPSDSISAKGGSAPAIQHSSMDGRAGCGARSAPPEVMWYIIALWRHPCPLLTELSGHRRQSAIIVPPRRDGYGRSWSLVRHITCPCPSTRARTPECSHPCAGKRAANGSTPSIYGLFWMFAQILFLCFVPHGLDNRTRRHFLAIS